LSRGCRIKFRVSGKAFAAIERRKRLGGGRAARLAAAAEIPKGASKLAPFTEIFTTDYRDVDGTKVPFSTKQVQNGKEVGILSVTEYKYDSNLDDSLFARPK